MIPRTSASDKGSLDLGCKITWPRSYIDIIGFPGNGLRHFRIYLIVFKDSHFNSIAESAFMVFVIWKKQGEKDDGYLCYLDGLANKRPYWILPDDSRTDECSLRLLHYSCSILSLTCLSCSTDNRLYYILSHPYLAFALQAKATLVIAFQPPLFNPETFRHWKRSFGIFVDASHMTVQVFKGK